MKKHDVDVFLWECDHGAVLLSCSWLTWTNWKSRVRERHPKDPAAAPHRWSSVAAHKVGTGMAQHGLKNFELMSGWHQRLTGLERIWCYCPMKKPKAPVDFKTNSGFLGVFCAGLLKTFIFSLSPPCDWSLISHNLLRHQCGLLAPV